MCCDIANTFHKDRGSHPNLFCKNVVFKKFTTFTIKQGTVSESRFEKSRAPLVDLRETDTQVFSCEFYKIFKNTYFKELLRMAAYCSKINHLPRRDKKR